MKTLSHLFIIFFASVLSVNAQTFTMGKKCRAKLEAAKAPLAEGAYNEALTQFDIFADDCKTKDAKEATAIGKAEAFNGLKNYDQAIIEADKALKITKDKSLGGHFQKGIALNGKGDIAGSKASLNQVMVLTENNQNTAERASNYALMAALYDRQLKEPDSALAYLNKAKELDPDNVNYMLQEGDLYLSKRDYAKAFKSYNAAAGMYPDSKEVYIAKSNAHLIMMEQKYSTTKAQELRTKMTTEERYALCADLQKALALGWQDMNKEMFSALVCK
jgi:tetratricopeptide (TPR) repeat protein